MVFLSYGIVIFLSVMIFLLYKFVFKKRDKINILLKILAVVLAIVFFIRYMSGRDQISMIYALKFGAFDSPFYNFIALMLNWTLNASILLITVGTFFDNKTVKNIIKFIVFPLTILSIVGLRVISIGIVGYNGYIHFNFRAILMACEVAIVLMYSVIIFLENNYFSITKKDAIKLLYFIPMMLSIIPTYAVQGLFGFANIAVEVKGFSLPHRIILYLGIILPAYCTSSYKSDK